MFLMLFMSILCQILFNSSLNVPKFLMCFLFIAPEAKAHTFSIGFKSGLFPGHVITFTWLFWNTLVAIALVWGVALSCWKEYYAAFPLKIALVAGNIFNCSSPLYSTAPMPLQGLPLAVLNCGVLPEVPDTGYKPTTPKWDTPPYTWYYYLHLLAYATGTSLTATHAFLSLLEVLN